MHDDEYLIKSDTLEDIADAIREKKQSQSAIMVSNYANEIENLPTGADLSDYFTSTIDSNGWTRMIKTIPSTTTVSGTDLTSAFTQYYGETIPLIDTSNVTSMAGMFQRSTNLKTIPLLNTSSVTTMGSMFQGCTSLTSVPLLDTSNVQSSNVSSMFYGCTNLTTVPAFNLAKVNNMNSMFYGCSNLTDTSLDNILLMCIGSNVTNTNRKKLSYIGISTNDYSTSRIEALPHYQDFINAGWTIS